MACAPLVVHILYSEECREEFQQNLIQRLLEHPHSQGSLPEDNWEQLKQCILESAEECVESVKKKQPDWFLDAVDTHASGDRQVQSTQQVSTNPHHCCQERIQKTTERAEEGGG